MWATATPYFALAFRSRREFVNSFFAFLNWNRLHVNYNFLIRSSAHQSKLYIKPISWNTHETERETDKQMANGRNRDKATIVIRILTKHIITDSKENMIKYPNYIINSTQARKSLLYRAVPCTQQIWHTDKSWKCHATQQNNIIAERKK